MEQGLMAMALDSPGTAAVIGLLLGLAATLTAGRVAHWTHLLGLRAQGPGHRWWWLAFSVLFAGLSAAVVVAGLPLPTRAFCLGVIWGNAGMDLANNARAMAALRAVAVDGPTLGGWLALPLATRAGLTASAAQAVLTILAIACLLTWQPSLFGLFAGAALQLLWQRRSVIQAQLAAQANAEKAPEA